jgi:hypothetical protein
VTSAALAELQVALEAFPDLAYKSGVGKASSLTSKLLGMKNDPIVGYKVRPVQAPGSDKHTIFRLAKTEIPS